MEKNRTQRERLVILGTILETCIEGAKKTHLMQKCNLSHARLVMNLETLMANDLIKSSKQEGGVTYVTTENGRCFLDSFDMLTSLLDNSHSQVYADYLPRKDKGYQS